MANEQDPSTAAEPGIGPEDIQRQEFGVSRFGGYRMRDVDEFLDRLTASTEALVAENERLRAGGSPIVGTSDLDEVNRQADEIVQRARDAAARIVAEAHETAADVPGGAAIAATPADKAAVDAFLTRERDFLQNLATLVQGHAESVKAMARKARQTPAPAVAETPVQTPPAEPPHPPVPTDDEPVQGENPAAPEDAAPVSQRQPVAGRTEAEGEGDPSLRRLFWGEEG